MSSLTLLQRFLVGDSDFRYFEDGRHFEEGSCHTAFFTSLIVTPWAAPPIVVRSNSAHVGFLKIPRYL